PAPLAYGEQDEQDAEGQLDGQDGGRGGGLRLGRMAARAQDDGGDHHDQAGQPAEDDPQALPGALLGAQDEDESRERERLESDREPGEQKVEYQGAPSARGQPGIIGRARR